MKKRLLSLSLVMMFVLQLFSSIQVVANSSVTLMDAFRDENGVLTVTLKGVSVDEVTVYVADYDVYGRMQNITSQNVTLTGAEQKITFDNIKKGAFVYVWDKENKPLTKKVKVIDKCDVAIESAFHHDDNSATVRIIGTQNEEAVIYIAKYDENNLLNQVVSRNIVFTGRIQEIKFDDVAVGSRVFVWDANGRPLAEQKPVVDRNEAETVYDIIGLEIKDNTAAVTLNSNSVANIVLSFKDEETKDEFYTAKGVTPDFCEGEAVDVTIDYELPKYFIVDAVLTDENGNELCNPIEFIEYTAAYEEFAALTVDDFQEERVLNFDEDRTTNFGVLADDVKVFDGTETTNVFVSSEPGADEMSYSYTFKNPDSKMKALKVGDKVYERDSECLFRIDKITTNSDGTITFEYIEDADNPTVLTDLYDTLKIDTVVEKENPEVQMLDENETALMAVSEPTEFSGTGVGAISGSVKVGIDDYLTLALTSRGVVTTRVKMVFDKDIFGEEYLGISINNTIDLNGELGVGVQIPPEYLIEKELTLLEIPISLGVPGLALDFRVKGFFELTVQADLTLEFGINGRFGVSYTTDTGFHYSQKFSTTQNLKFEGEGEAAIGPRVELALIFGVPGTPVKDLINADVSIEYGWVAHCVFSLNDNTDPSLLEESYHGCIYCLEGELSRRCKFGTKGGLKLTKWLEYYLWEYEKEFAKRPVPIGKNGESAFYFSISNEEDSLFGGEETFGTGECPNKKYRVCFAVEDSHGTELSDKKVTIKKGNKVIAEGSMLTEYLFDGVYTASVETDSGKTITKSFTVYGEPKTVEIKLPDEKQRVSFVVKDTSGKILDDVVVTVIDDDDKVVAQGTNLVEYLSPGDYSASVVDDNGTQHVQFFTVDGKVHEVVFELPQREYYVNVIVRNEDGEVYGDKVVTITKGDEVIAEGVMLNIPLTDGEYCASTVDNDGELVVTYFTVNGKEMTVYLEIEKEKEEEEPELSHVTIKGYTYYLQAGSEIPATKVGITIYDAEGNKVGSTSSNEYYYSDEAAAFSFSGYLPYGTYTLRAFKDGHTLDGYIIHFNVTKTFTVSSSEQTIDLGRIYQSRDVTIF